MLRFLKQGNMQLIADILDIDEIGSDGVPDIDLIDTFSRNLTFDPSPDFLSAPSHMITYTHHTR